ncbi:hypothetical protein CHS0354_012288 [Potamilus streckersoni]|uniref:Uncharacterized protein n=1 Tax=Potamilus streckersoni TaxID=2493646 RepID=A0AAE0VUP6_9BIVA|nr:hypothetical protein CHS0354_012288 [Potamilus streckersoni]
MWKSWMSIYFLNYVTYYCIITDACLPGYFGPNCAHLCNCRAGSTCKVTGQCKEGCKIGWSGPLCQKENVAYNKPAYQKSDNLTSAELAVDDDISTCAVTLTGMPGWWSVDLGQIYMIKSMFVLTNRLMNLKGVQIYVGREKNMFQMTLCITLRVYGQQASVTCDVPLIGRYVRIINVSGPVILCDVAVYICSSYFFGEECGNQCNCANETEMCNPYTGECSSGCAMGWTGKYCNTECLYRYGQDCRNRCGHCAEGVRCDTMTGFCEEGCEPGWKGIRCDQPCENGTYGENCLSKCGHCRQDEACDVVSGNCRLGCEAGYMDNRCDTVCPHGTYGEDCVFECGHCVHGTICDKVHGFCPAGCHFGWEGVFCSQTCLPGRYGRNCHAECTGCLEGICHPETGKCSKGCTSGRSGPSCDDGCQSGRFGINCEGTCERCKDGEACDPVTGICQAGCLLGFSGSHCLTGCDQGLYGPNCTKKCGFCKKGTVCDSATGLCPDGCVEGYNGDRCMQGHVFNDDSGPQVKIFLGVTIGVVGTMMTIVITCLVLIWQREKLPKKNPPKQHKTSTPVKETSRSIGDTEFGDDVVVV